MAFALDLLVYQQIMLNRTAPAGIAPVSELCTALHCTGGVPD